MEATENKDIDMQAEEMEESGISSEDVEMETDGVQEETANGQAKPSEMDNDSQEDSEQKGDSEDDSEENASANEKKGLFKKKEKKNKQEEKIAELNDRVQRQMAEFDNFRKRTEKEKAQMFEVGAKSIIEKILPVVDNFERGLSAVPEESKNDPFVEGMDKIYKQLMTELE